MIPGIRFARATGEDEGGVVGFFVGLGRPHLRRIFLLFTATTMAAGVIVTFLPLAVPGSGVFSAAGALLVVGLTSTLSRWWGGRFGDRRDPRLLLTPGLITCAVGVAVLPFGGVLLMGGAVLFGTGFGLLQNSTLILMMGCVSKSEFRAWEHAVERGLRRGDRDRGLLVRVRDLRYRVLLVLLTLLGPSRLPPSCSWSWIALE